MAPALDLVFIFFTILRGIFRSLSSKVLEMLSSSLTNMVIYDFHYSKYEKIEFVTSLFLNRG